MSRRFQATILILVSIVAIPHFTVARNRFNVITYNDNHLLANRQTFYQWLDEWGATIIHASSDTVSKYIVLDTLGYVVSSAHFLDGQRIRLLDGTAGIPVYLNQSTSYWMSTYTGLRG